MDDIKYIHFPDDYMMLRRFFIDSRLSGNEELLRELISSRQYQMMQMYYEDQTPMQEIAKEFGINVSTVSRTIKRGSLKLKKWVALSELRRKNT